MYELLNEKMDERKLVIGIFLYHLMVISNGYNLLGYPMVGFCLLFSFLLLTFQKSNHISTLEDESKFRYLMWHLCWLLIYHLKGELMNFPFTWICGGGETSKESI